MESVAFKLDERMRNMIIDYVPSGELLDDLTDLFSVFSDKTRLRIVCALAMSRTCVTDIADILSINQTTVSHQLRLLRNLGIVGCERDGKVIYYTLKHEIINEILLKGVEFLAAGNLA